MLNRIFSPIRIGNLEIPNRLVVPAMVMNFCNADGTATERFIAYHEAKARGGWGLIITEDYAVAPGGKGFANIPGLWEDGQIEGHARFTRRVHAAGKSKLFAQIYHAGRQTTSRVSGAQPVAPSALPCPVMQQTPHALTVPEIRKIVEQFGDCALRVKKAGFDGIEIHGAHGYLIAEFMSSYSNKRSDAYGGNLMKRLRFPLEIMADVRSKVGPDFPVSFRISGEELVPGGSTIEDTKAICLLLQDSGIDAFHVSAGVYGTTGITPPASVGHGWITHYAAEVKNTVKVPVITVGRINDPFLAEAILVSGKADLVAMGRASLADPDLPKKAEAGCFDEITPCIACLQGCIGKIAMQQPGTCLVNPALGREEEMKIQPAESRKKVLVAGAGPAGAEAAIVAAQRGHEVHLYEKSDRLGGQFSLAAVSPSKGEIAGFIAWQKQQLDLGHVIVHLNTELTGETVAKERPDAVIVATGSKPLVPEVSGLGNKKVVTAQQILEGAVSVGARVAVIGGGMVGSETADHLSSLGREVTVIEMLPTIAQDEVPMTRQFLLKRLEEKRVRIYVRSTLKDVREDGSLTIESGGMMETIGPFDSIILATGGIPCNELAVKLAGQVDKVITIGDAKSFRKAIDAIEEGYRAGLEI